MSNQPKSGLDEKFVHTLFHITEERETLYDEVHDCDSIYEEPAGHMLTTTYTVLGIPFRSRKCIWDQPL